MTDLTVSLRLLLQSREFARGLQGSERGVTDFASRGRRAVGQLDQTVRGLRNSLAGLGVGVAIGSGLRESALLDRNLARIARTAGVGAKGARELRTELFKMARETGRPIEGLQDGFAKLVASGLEFNKALAATRAINRASAVTGADEGTLGSALSVAAEQFDFDLGQAGVAVDLLDKMYVAADLASAELTDLPGIFARVGGRAKEANLSFAETLGFIEGLSKVEPNADRLGTLADSTLRIFTVDAYRKAAQRATGVPFFANGEQRAPFDVLSGFSDKLSTARNGEERSALVASAFGTADQDTIKGLLALLSPGSLQRVVGFSKTIDSASANVARNLPEGIDDAASQSGRLTASLRQASEAFTKPINRALADLIEFQLDPVEKGGLGLGPGGAALATGGLVIAAGAAGKLASNILSSIPFIGGAAADAAGTAAGLAQGQLIKQAGLATPVFVTNFPAGSTVAGGGAAAGLAEVAGGVAAGAAAKGLIGRLLGRFGLTTAAGIGSAALGTAGVLAAGAGGFEVGTAAYHGSLGTPAIAGTEFADQVGRAVAIALATFGVDAAREALISRAKEPTDLTGTIRIELDSNGARVRSATAPAGVDFDFRSGPLALVPN